MKQLLPLICCLSILVFTSCEDVLDCLIESKSPELPEISLDSGIYGDYYYQIIEADIRNEVDDNAYHYTFEIEGQLPDGISMSVNHRTLTFEGVAQKTGSYPFKLFLDVEPPLDYDYSSGEFDDDMCSTSTSKEFTITINYL